MYNNIIIANNYEYFFFIFVVTNLQQLANDGRIKQITWTVGYCLYIVRLSFIAVTTLYDRYTITLSGTNSS